MSTEADIFIGILIAAMEDAVTTGHISQLQTTMIDNAAEQFLRRARSR
jgi:hypothetical protein